MPDGTGLNPKEPSESWKIEGKQGGEQIGMDAGG
jgi:hypothetical protein